MWITAHFPGPPFVSHAARFKAIGSTGYVLLSERWRRVDYDVTSGRGTVRARRGDEDQRPIRISFE